MWLISTPDAVRGVGGNYYHSGYRRVIKSSLVPHEHDVLWFNRGIREDPWISVQSHTFPANLASIVYGEGGYDIPTHTDGKNSHGGANVYIRDTRPPQVERFCVAHPDTNDNEGAANDLIMMHTN